MLWWQPCAWTTWLTRFVLPCEASLKGHLKMIQLLLEARLEVSRVSRSGASPLSMRGKSTEHTAGKKWPKRLEEGVWS